MTADPKWSRRSTLGALAAVALAQSADAQHANLEGASSAPTTGDVGGVLETAFDQARRVTVPVHINSRGPFEFVVDTGANSSLVSTEVAAECGLPSAGPAVIHSIIGPQDAQLARVSRLRVGGVVSANLRLPMEPQARIGAAGILGLDMFRDRHITLDFKNGSFEIEPNGYGPGVARGSGSRVYRSFAPVTVPARYKSGQLVILDAEVLGRPIIAFLDSGSQVTIVNRVLRDEVFRLRPDIAGKVLHSQLISATGQQATAEFAPLAGLRLGGQVLNSAFVAFADLHIFDLWDLRDSPTMLIGVDILRRFDRVAFDFGRKEITFWPSRGPPPGGRATGAV